jgi:hypothetical protein
VSNFVDYSWSSYPQSWPFSEGSSYQHSAQTGQDPTTLTLEAKDLSSPVTITTNADIRSASLETLPRKGCYVLHIMLGPYHGQGHGTNPADDDSWVPTLNSAQTSFNAVSISTHASTPESSSELKLSDYLTPESLEVGC